MYSTTGKSVWATGMAVGSRHPHALGQEGCVWAGRGERWDLAASSWVETGSWEDGELPHATSHLCALVVASVAAISGAVGLQTQ